MQSLASKLGRSRESLPPSKMSKELLESKGRIYVLEMKQANFQQDLKALMDATNFQSSYLIGVSEDVGIQLKNQKESIKVLEGMEYTIQERIGCRREIDELRTFIRCSFHPYFLE